MNEKNEASLHPLLSFATGVADDAVALSFEPATDMEQCETRNGSWVSTAMTADVAIELGETLIELGKQLRTERAVN